jgi:hypothetical protein
MHCPHYALHSLCTALTMHCTHYALHSLCTALIMHCPRYALRCPRYALPSLCTALAMHCPHYALPSRRPLLHASAQYTHHLTKRIISLCSRCSRGASEPECPARVQGGPDCCGGVCAGTIISPNTLLLRWRVCRCVL